MVNWLYNWLWNIVHKDDDHVLAWSNDDDVGSLVPIRAQCKAWVDLLTDIIGDGVDLPVDMTVEHWDERADKYGIYIDWTSAANLRYWPTHVWITENGMWDDCPEWAKAFLVNFPEAGGATHMFGKCLDVNGNTLQEKNFRLYWPGGEDGAKPQASGWANFFTNSKYDPSKTPGPYGLHPLNGVAVVGGGQPYGSPHVSIFCVWKERW